MASTIMMQNMCNNQINDLGMYGTQYNQVYYGSPYTYDPNFATSPDCSPDFAGGAMLVNPQSLAMPPMSYSGGVSPQIMPMGYPAFSPPPMLPILDMNMPSVSPPPTGMGSFGSLVPPVPMMGYSMIPIPQTGMTLMGLPQANGSVSPDVGYLIPEIAYSTGSISRSPSPVSDEVFLPHVIPADHRVQEITRERQLSASVSVESLDSNGLISKKELVADCLKKFDHIFGRLVQTTGMRGPTVMRIKVKTRPALELIVDLLKALEQNCNICAISCPKSTKKGKQHIRGFLAYIQTSTVAEIDRVQRVFDEFNRAHTTGVAAPFKTLEVNPQKKK